MLKKICNFNKMKIVLLTFGGGSKKYYDAVCRLVKQAQSYDIFDKIIGLTDIDLQKKFPDFWKEHSNFISNNRRGYGYWVWKPFIIYETMKTMDKGDILLYLDCGCELNLQGKSRFMEYIELVKTNQRMLFHLEENHTERRWCKMDLIRELGFDKEDKCLLMPQAESGMQFYINNKENLKLLKDYCKYGSMYHLIDDSPSKRTNFLEFEENRHDQSVLSLLFKRNSYYSMYDETYPVTMKGDKSRYPIWSIRNYSNDSKINYN